jgi:hypothetical protein
LNAFHSIETILPEIENPLKENFWDEPQAVFPWNSYLMEAATEGGGLSINNPVIKNFWTKYYSFQVDCQNEELCYYKSNCGGTHTTESRAADANITE